MSCCLNPDCRNPKSQDNSKFCTSCGYPIPELLLDRFKVQKVIAQGGFGRTYLAIDRQKLDEQCVLKQLIYSSQEPNVRQRTESMFFEEARQLQALGTHPQIPTLFAFFTLEGQQYLVQEWIDGHTLKQELSHGKFSEAKIRAFLGNILPVLKFIHQNNVIHRDIKPENIMRHQQTGKLMLIDFGISKTFCFETLTNTGTIVGSHGYSSREQIMEGKTSPATDLFSLGVCCFHLLTHVSPLDLSVNFGFSWIESWRSHLSQSITPDLAALITKLLAVNVSDRYQSVDEVQQDLQNLSEPPTEIHFNPTSEYIASPNSIKTTPMEADPYLTQEISSTGLRVNAPRANFNISRRQLLKYLCLSFAGGVGAIAVWRAFGTHETVSRNQAIPLNLKGRSQVIGQFETVQINRLGQIQTPTPITIDLIREDLGEGVFLDLATIPAGAFKMGSPSSELWRDEDEGPRYTVQISAFLMGIYEVTQRQWQAVARMPKVNIDLRVGDSTFEGERRPIERVTWYEAQEFCSRLSRETGHQYRLPSEAEWEYACRAGNTDPFAFGSTIAASLANYDANTTYGPESSGEFRKQTTDVGEFYANAWGLHDMHGNVMEWCRDNWHDSYENAPNDGSAWMANGQDKYRVLRGGSWFDPPRITRSANRSKKRPKSRQGDVGLRVVCTL